MSGRNGWLRGVKVAEILQLSLHRCTAEGYRRCGTRQLCCSGLANSREHDFLSTHEAVSGGGGEEGSVKGRVDDMASFLGPIHRRVCCQHD